MFNLKAIRVIAGFFMSGLVVMSGCTDAGDGGDATPDDTPDGGITEPVPMAFTADDAYVECSGMGLSDSTWTLFLSNDGEAAADGGFEPYVTIYDNSANEYDDPSEAYLENVTLELAQSHTENSFVYAQDWAREDLPPAGSLADYVEDENSIFQCANINDLTFVFTAYDAVSLDEIQVALGDEPDVYCPDCSDSGSL